MWDSMVSNFNTVLLLVLSDVLGLQHLVLGHITKSKDRKEGRF